MTYTRVMSAVVFLLCVLLSLTTFADEKKKKPTKEQLKEALELIQGANDDYDAGDYKYALEGYQEAYEIYPSEVLLYQMGLTHEKLKNMREAVLNYSAYLEAVPDGKKSDDAKKRRDALKKDLPPTVEFVTVPEGAEVYVDDPNSEAVASTPQLLEVEEGEYVFYVKKDGFKVEEIQKTVAKGEDVVIDLELKPLKGSFEDDDGVELFGDKKETDTGGGSALTTWGWVAVGVGAAALVTGGVFSLLSNGKTVEVNGYNKQSPDASREELEDLKSSATGFYETALGLYIAGGVIAATGVTLILIDSSSSDSDTAWKLEFSPTTQGAAVQLRGSF